MSIELVTSCISNFNAFVLGCRTVNITMINKLRRRTILQLYLITTQVRLSITTVEEKVNRWYVGRTPPSSFEYSRINGFYSPKRAQTICERDQQCGGFTFKGPRIIRDYIPEVYFFHFINTSSNYLTTDIKHPHWTSYVVASRDYIIIPGSYPTNNDTSSHILHRL